MRGAFGILLALALSGGARAQDNPACAKYASPLAYNACLAKLGPKAGVTHATSAPAAYAPARTRGVLTMSRTRRGRVEAVFTVSGKSSHR